MQAKDHDHIDTVSVVIPVYNSEKYLTRCLHSVCGQSYPALEILVVDDGSTDGSPQILRRFAERDRRIRLLTQTNQGVSAARNAALDVAIGRYLTFVDSDDYLSRTYIEDFVRRMEETGADMVIGGVSFVTPEGKVLRRLVPDVYMRGRREEWPMRLSAVCAHFYERRIWEEGKIRFAEGVRGEDIPIALYFSAACRKISILHTAGYGYVQHPSSAMHTFRGLKTWSLPLEAVEESIRAVKEKEGIRSARTRTEEKGIQASRVRTEENWFCLFVLRILATFYFDLARGADQEKKRELTEYISRILRTYFPHYRENPLVRLTAKTDFPFPQKLAVWLLIRLESRGLLGAVSRLL